MISLHSQAKQGQLFFGNWAELIPLHKDMLAEMRSNDRPLDAVLQDYLPKLAAPYQKYCSRIPQAQHLYTEKVAEKAFISFEQTFADINKPTLNHFMRPVPIPLKGCINQNGATS